MVPWRKGPFWHLVSDPLRGHQTDGTGPQRFLVSAGQHQHGGAGPNAVEAREVNACGPEFPDQYGRAAASEMRMQQSDFFFPAYVATIRDRVATHIDGLLDEMERKGPVVDFAKMFSEELPLFTLCEMLGVDERDRPAIKVWMHHLELAAQFLANPWQTFSRNPCSLSVLTGSSQICLPMVSASWQIDAATREDLLTIIAQSKLNGELLPQEFLDGSWLLIIFAGNDTSRNSLSGTIRLMNEFPDQRAMVLEDPALIPQMSEEALRMVSPVIHMRRTATEDAEINGQRIAKDEKVVLWYGAANRDPDIFPNPDTFDMHRPNVEKHLAFGHGVHKCLGSRIAKMQLRLAFERIFERFPISIGQASKRFRLTPWCMLFPAFR